ncbi:formylglycine-generating enzyme family protein [Motilimonas eburnea]|uniref:formylglycine-generating enzyme family protein n=1 Tax=Motilimonas eburnea TaxID=1737488 RepID=UPI001E404A34|nr:formylglycine-generating enzyme family protein [Motilimonas eburnea]MCE2570224.1 SUMF1/EgtB/PvdO family nonheme iron enzyme [Motilimonas eburnea]
MRIAPLVLSAGIFSLGMAATPLYASQVTELDNKIQTKQAEFDAYVDGLEKIRSSIQQDKDELQRLIELNTTLENKRKAALLEMDKQYELLVADPSLDISAAIEAYQYALQAQSLNKEKVKAQKTLLASNQEKLANSKVTQFSMLNEIENLKERFNFARVERIKREFSQGGKMEVSQSIACGEDVTFKQCAEQGNNLAKKTASQMLTNKLFQNVTEQALVSKHRDTAAAGIKIVSEKVLESGFSGQGDYSVKMLVEMEGRLPQAQACRLLSLDYRYCGVNSDQAAAGDYQEVEFSPIQNEPGMVTLTVRSNQFHDEVFINGKSYGASRVDAMLPPGEYKVTVKKPGFHTFNTTVKLSGARTIRAELNRLVVNLKPGQKFSDQYSDGSKAPAMVAIGSGSYRIGDIQGRGLGNEKAPSKVTIGATFGIGQKEVTVAEFEKFVNATGYRTTAEKGKGCASYSSGAPEYSANMSWREPGFEQSKRSPVVCVTSADAEAYTKWLSRSTGYQYRLPTETEWEVAARGGTSTDYWWGNNVGAGNANCGWCGSRWSNNGTAPTASFKANKFGLFDTVGNVWELTDSNPAVVRGGAWNFAPSLARASSRLEISSSFAANYIGFRVVRAQ